MAELPFMHVFFTLFFFAFIKNNLKWQMAACWGREDCVALLLKQGASIEMADNRKGATALHLAAQFGQPAVVRLLVAKKVNVEAMDYEGMTPLHVCACCGQTNEISSAAMLISDKRPLDLVASFNGSERAMSVTDDRSRLTSSRLSLRSDISNLTLKERFFCSK